MAAGPVRVDQRPDQRAVGGAQPGQVDDQTPGPHPHGGVDQHVAQVRGSAGVQVAADRDQRRRLSDMDADRRAGRDRNAVGLPLEPPSQRLQCPLQQAGDVHLRHAEVPADLLLSGVAEEVPGQDVTLPLGQPEHQFTQGYPVGGQRQKPVVVPDKVEALGALAVGRHRRVQRCRIVRVPRRQGLDDLGGIHPQVGGEVRHGRRPSQPMRQRRAGLGQLEVPFL
ncbi:hypothetical protein ODJ79_41850 [Actinoplanes sp. KI2]|nr:hypothetical protein [Actinoplanes sp. KI2]MCU7730302.1 hypothetical protein [Actinoplanes sp. KI2]